MTKLKDETELKADFLKMADNEGKHEDYFRFRIKS